MPGMPSLLIWPQADPSGSHGIIGHRHRVTVTGTGTAIQVERRSRRAAPGPLASPSACPLRLTGTAS